MFEVFQEKSISMMRPQSQIFLDQLASADPTPGGGSAAAHTGAAAAALITMVGRVTVGKKKYCKWNRKCLQ